jgi:hypothetical protein
MRVSNKKNPPLSNKRKADRHSVKKQKLKSYERICINLQERFPP